jgi:hypothetical protein
VVVVVVVVLHELVEERARVLQRPEPVGEHP